MLATDTELEWGPSTIRNELAMLEEHGLLAHPHTSAGRVPTDAGYRYFVDRLLPATRDAAAQRPLALSLVRREVDEAMRVTTETLSQVTNLLAIVSAPPIETATIRHVEVLLLQPQVLMVVVITSTGGVTKRMLTFDQPVDAGLADWGASYLNEHLVGLGLGARLLHQRLDDPIARPARARLPRGDRARVHGADGDGRGLALRRRRRAARRASYRFEDHRAAQRGDGDARAARDAARRAALGARRSATSTCASGARTRRRRCARSRSSRPATACRRATSAPSR